MIGRLREAPPKDRLLGWVVTVVITLLALGVRFAGLDYPSDFVFDETYYAKDAWSVLTYGYERSWVEGANEILESGDYSKAQEEDPDAVAKYCPDGVETCTWNGLKDGAAFIVHPQVGKWLIAAGEAMFGFNSFGWRFMPLLFGSLLVFVTIRLARRLSRSTLIGGLAGVLLTCDGLAFVMSRTALLDIFQAFFIVAAVGCVVADRDYFRHRLADRIEGIGLANPRTARAAGRPRPPSWRAAFRTAGGRSASSDGLSPSSPASPASAGTAAAGTLVAVAAGSPLNLNGRSGGFIFRPWLLAAGLLFGLACGTKWNSMYPLAVCGVLVLVWSISARRLAGARNRMWDAVWLDGIPAFFSMVVVGFITYTASWFSWLKSSAAWDRDWGAAHPDDPLVKLFGNALGSLAHYHTAIYDFHVGEQMANATHHYSSNPWGWLVLAKPIGFDAVNKIQPGTDGCPPDGGECLRVISGTGTPLLWWAAAAAFIIGLVWWLAGADWRFGVVSLAMLSTWAPWIMDTVGRPLFFFYAITMVPFTVIGLAMALGVLLGPANAGRRRWRGAVAVGVIVGLIIVDFAFIYPILTDDLLQRSHWQWRMWFTSWI
ncbi:MAG: phospholipid carrier-dependent glycosyltransferase [Propionibacteriaceae bacterium]|nr:phospholipid carrier-dependent glycosyltransferase [Propionibacteriaceae bacterium]